MIPTPQYVVFYNGDEIRPAVEKQRLSESFLDSSVRLEYEWTATAYNLYDENNSMLLEACKPLSDYMYVVDMIKTGWRSGMSKGDALRAVDYAVTKCIQDGILSEFLTKHRAEVIDVCLTEFDEKKYADTLISQGIEQGIEQGIAKIVLQMLNSGKTAEDIHEFCGIPIVEIEKYRNYCS